MTPTALLLVSGALLVAAFAVSWRRSADREGMLRSDEDARRIFDGARRRSDALVEEARLKNQRPDHEGKGDHEQQAQRDWAELRAIEKRLLAREEVIDIRNVTFESRSVDLVKQEQFQLDRKHEMSISEAKLVRLIADARDALRQVAGLTREEAKRALVEAIAAEVRHEAA